MDREQLDHRNTDTIRKHFRQLDDSGGRASQQLLDELAATAGEYAGNTDGEHRGEHAPAEPKPEPRPAPRRTAARRTAK